MEGQFDEQESHNSFLEALKAWRGEKPSAEDTPKSVRFSDNKEGAAAAAAGKPPANKNFFANLNNEEFNVNCLPEPPTYAATETQPDSQMADPKFAAKDSCWQCYKLYPRAQPVTCQISGKVSHSFCQCHMLTNNCTFCVLEILQIALLAAIRGGQHCLVPIED